MSRHRSTHPDSTKDAAHSGHGTTAVVAALVANLAIAIAKFTGFLVTQSSAMLAEAVHSVADSGNQALLLVGGRRSRKAADEDHQFGYGREAYFWGFVVALVLFALGSLFAIYEGLHKLDHPEAVKSPQWALGILGFALVVEGLSFRTAVRATRQVKGDGSYWKFIRRAKSPELPVVLLEDLGAIVGLFLALAGLSAAMVTDDGRWDAYATLAIGVLLGLIAVVLVVEMKSLLIGESATPKEDEAIRATIEVDPDVIRLIHVRTQYLGPDELMIGAKIELHHELTAVEVADTVNRLERNLRSNIAGARYIYLEPDVHDDHRVATSYVAEHSGHIDQDDPRYTAITGLELDPDDDIWTE